MNIMTTKFIACDSSADSVTSHGLDGQDSSPCYGRDVEATAFYLMGVGDFFIGDKVA
jgi:hypothetical protein